MRIVSSGRRLPVLAFAALVAGTGAVFAAFVTGIATDTAPRLPYDTPTEVRGVEAVCTGAGANTRNEYRWNAYPLKVEVAGAGGQYLGYATVTVERDDELVTQVVCGGPWVLFRLDPGHYRVSATVDSVAVSSSAYVPAIGQGRIVLRFPEEGGKLSPEYVPALE